MKAPISILILVVGCLGVIVYQWHECAIRGGTLVKGVFGFVCI